MSHRIGALPMCGRRVPPLAALHESRCVMLVEASSGHEHGERDVCPVCELRERLHETLFMDDEAREIVTEAVLDVLAALHRLSQCDEDNYERAHQRALVAARALVDLQLRVCEVTEPDQPGQ